jgi:lysophospholipase L1-like esterase
MTGSDLRAEQFRALVVLGESTVEGGPWLHEGELRWADVLANLISACQETPVTYRNEGIGASVISPRSPGYEHSRKPSALERYRERVIAVAPDLFVLAYGLNDMRAGMPVEEFAGDLRTIVRDVQAACRPVTVLTTVYHMTRFECYPPFDRGGREVTLSYNRAIAEVAKDTQSVLADLWSAEGEADWLIHQDGVHANAVGNLVLAHRVFEAIAVNCSGLTRRTTAAHEDTAWTRECRAMNRQGIEPLDR